MNKEKESDKKAMGIAMAVVMLASIFAMIAPAFGFHEVSVPDGEPGIYFLNPKDSSKEQCQSQTIDVWANSFMTIRSGKVTIVTTDKLCGNITGATWNSTEWNSGAANVFEEGRRVVMGYSDTSDNPVGNYHIGTITVHCNSSIFCVAGLNFTYGAPETYIANTSAGSISAGGENGTFACEAAPCHDVNITTDFAGAVDGIKIIKDGAAIPADQNLTIGEEYQIRSRIVNDGDFNETVNVTITVTNATGIPVFQPSMFQKTVNISEHQDAYRNWDTTGLALGNYNITVNVSIPVDDDWSNNERTREVTLESPAPPGIIFDTGPGTYPSIFGIHNGTITPSQTITVSRLYTYPCEGTSGHTEYVKIWNETCSVEASWNGYLGDWHNITFEPFTLEAGVTYSYTLKTGSYPQIIHQQMHHASGGTITCTDFKDATNRLYNRDFHVIKYLPNTHKNQQKSHTFAYSGIHYRNRSN